ncbi:MAG TPA: polysaccharide biosynthesis protein, partial [Trueperaceae bacterium]
MKSEAPRLPFRVARAVNIDLSRFSAGFKLGLDLVLWLVAAPLAFLARFDATVVTLVPQLVLATGLFVAAKLTWSLLTGLEQQSWTKVAFRDLAHLLAFAAGTGTIGALLLLAPPLAAVPVSVAVLDAVITLLLMLGVRAASRYLHERQLQGAVEPRKRRCVLIVGAGEAGSLAVREMLRHPETGLRPVGFLDDDPRKQGKYIAGVPVVGRVEDIAGTVGRLAVDEVLIAIPSAEGRTIRNIVHRIDEAKTGIKT